MENNTNVDNSKRIITVLVILIVALGTLCFLFATGRISLDKNKELKPVDNTEVGENTNIDTGKKEDTSSKDSVKQEEKPVNQDTSNKNAKVQPWVEYLLKQKDLTMNFNRYVYNEKIEEEKTYRVEMPLSETKEILNILGSYGTKGTYIGGSGFTFGDEIIVSYTKNGKKYEACITEGSIGFQVEIEYDAELLNQFRKSDNYTEGKGTINEETYLDIDFIGYDAKAFDKYL